MCSSRVRLSAFNVCFKCLAFEGGCCAGLPSVGEGDGKESVRVRALDNIMKLLTSQISLEKRSKSMEVR
jgi:hypothetical protein